MRIKNNPLEELTPYTDDGPDGPEMKTPVNIKIDDKEIQRIFQNISNKIKNEDNNF